MTKGLSGRHPFACGLPLTMTLPRKLSSLVARSRRGLKANSSGVVSISVVVAWPARNCGWAMTFSRNGMFVFTPRMRNSLSTRSVRLAASGNVRAQVITFTSSES